MTSETAIDLTRKSEESESILSTLQTTIAYIPVILVMLLLSVFTAVGLLALRKAYLRRRVKRKSLEAVFRSTSSLVRDPRHNSAAATEEKASVLSTPSLSPTLASADASRDILANPVDVGVETEPRLERITPSHHRSSSMTRIHNQHTLQHQKNSTSDSIRLSSIEEGMARGKDDIV